MNQHPDQTKSHPVPTSKRYALISACFGLASRRRGAVRGPSALRDAGVLSRIQELNINIVDAGVITEPAEQEIIDATKKHLPEVLTFGNQLLDTLRAVYLDGRTPVILGGDHSLSIASFTAAAEHARSNQLGDIALLWIDAHPDINTPETTPSGNIHGMSVAHLLGMGEPALTHLGGFSPKLTPHQIIYLGLRSVDAPEVQRIKELGITAYTMHEIDRFGIGSVWEQISNRLRSFGGFVVSFDLDVCDPIVAPGVGTPVRGGLTYRESHLIMELAAELPGLLAVELVEYNPDTDNRGTTAEFAIGLIESAVGKRIL
jgi:arginase